MQKTAPVMAITGWLLSGWIAQGALFTWDGESAANTRWSNPTNWAGGNTALPGPDDDVVFDGSSVKPALLDRSFTIRSLTVAPAYTGTNTQNADLTVLNDFTLSNGLWQYTVGTQALLSVTGSMTVASRLLCQRASSVGHGTGRVFTVGGNLVVESGGVLDADYLGFPAQQGPAPGLSTPQALWSSGSHGGCGDNTQFPTYGSIQRPTALGSGGRDFAGGGAIRLNVAGTTTINGLVTAKGLCTGVYWGGAGGSVLLQTARLDGTGTVSAAGGVTTNASHGGGGGGRIAAILTEGEDFGAVRFQAWGGVCTYFGSGEFRNAGAGTVYLQTASQADNQGMLIVDNNNGASVNRTLISAAVSDSTVGTLVITNKGRLEIQSDQTMTVLYGLTNNTQFQSFGGTFEMGAEDGFLMSGGMKTSVFCNLLCTNAGAQIRFAAGYTCSVTNVLVLKGAPGSPLLLRSTAESAWNLTLAAGKPHDVFQVDVRHSNARGGAPVEAVDCTDSGFNTNWIFGALGQTNTWNGSVSTNWGTDANWDLGRPTLPSDTVVIPAGKPRYPSLDLTKFIAALVVSNGASLRTAGRNLAVYGNARIPGCLAASAGETITFGGEADFTGGTFTQALSRVVMGGSGAQTLTADGNRFHSLAVENTTGTVTFLDAITATNLLNAGGTLTAADTLTAALLYNAGGSLTVSGAVTAAALVNAAGVASFRSTVAAGVFTNTGTLTFGADLTARDFVCPAGGRTLTFQAGADYTITSSLEFYGSAGNPLVLRSSSDGAAWRLNATGLSLATYVDVKDSDARGGRTIRPILSTDSTGNQNWDFGASGDWLTWTGGASIQFTNPPNWLPAVAPSAGSLCLIDGQYVNAPTLSTNVTVAQLVVGGSSSAVLTVNAPLTVTGDAEVMNKGTLTHTANTTNERYKLAMTVGGDLVVRGEINTIGRGYAAQQGPGKGIADSGKWGSGSYGGRGWGQVAGNTYGSIIAPTNLGSGGRDYAGGGAILLNVAGNTHVDGLVGSDGIVLGQYYGGSGGSVFLTSGTLTGAGIVSANGSEEPGLRWGSGGGGRVAVRLTSGASFGDVQIRAWGGYAPNFNGTAGGAGTVYLVAAGQGIEAGTLIVDNNNKSYPYTTMIGANVSDRTAGDVIIRNAARLQIETNQSLTVSGSWSNGAVLISDTGSTVVLTGPGAATMRGSNVFWNLTAATAGKTLAFEAGRTNWVNGGLTLRGVTLGSTVPGAWSYLRLAPSASQDVQRVSVRDCSATNGQTIIGLKSLDLGHDVNWTFTPIPGTVIVVR